MAEAAALLEQAKFATAASLDEAAAKAVALGTGAGLVGVNHLEGHIWANFLEHGPPEPPYVALVVSGGHTMLVHMPENHRYELLGHKIGKRVSVEPYLISLDQQSEVFPLFQHAGVELIHVLEGEVVYRAAGSTYLLRPGDSLMFDGNTPHGPEELVALPIRFLSVITRAADE